MIKEDVKTTVNAGETLPDKKLKPVDAKEFKEQFKPVSDIKFSDTVKDDKITELEGEPRKRRKRRIKKVDVKLPVKSEQLITLIFDGYIAKRAGDIWKLSTDEKTQLSGATDALLMKYLPAVGKYGEEFAFFTVLSVIVIPRFMAKPPKFFGKKIPPAFTEIKPQRGEDEKTK